MDELICAHEKQEYDSMKDGYEWFKCLSCPEFIARYIDCGHGR